MNYKLALQEFTAFRDEVQRISFAFPPNDARIDSSYDKCQSMLDTLFRLQTHSFGVQLAGLRVKNVGAKSSDKASRLKLLVDNIIDDIKIREKSGPATNPLEDIASKQLASALGEHKKALENATESNKILQGYYDGAVEQFDQLKQLYDTLESQYDSASGEAKTFEKLLSRYRIGMLILGLISFTYVNFTAHNFFDTEFNLKLFTLIESIYFLGFFIYHFKKIPKWVITALGLIAILVLGVYLFRQPGWEVQLTTALWTLLGSLITAYMVYILKWNK